MDKQKRLIRNGTVVFPDQLLDVSLLVAEGKVAAILDKDAQPEDDWKITDAGGKIIMPGMIDTHNHMADPGPFRFREDWYHGSCSAASGGITTICDMPLPSEPATVNRKSFELKKQTAESRSVVDFALWGGLIPSSIPDMKEMHELGCVGFKGFMCFATEDYPRISDGYLADGMEEAASFHGLIALHAENAEAADLGCRRYGEMRCEDEARFDDARPWWTEYDAIQRSLLFAKMKGARIELCHTTICQGMELIKEARNNGVSVYVETCPHYLIFDHTVLRTRKSFAKCTPPFRSRNNVEKLWDYIKDGTVDVIGSDHGPFTDEEKTQNQDFWKEYCGFGCNDVVMAAMISEGVHKRGLSWPRLAAVGALFCDCAGVTFIILEAQMLLGCFFAVIAGYYFQSWAAGVLCAVLASILLGWFFIWITMKMKAIELVVGFAINFLVDGLTIYLLRMVFHQTGSFVSPEIPAIPRITVPVLSRIPLAGILFDQQTWIVYFAFFSVLAASVLIYHTAFGLHILSSGANPEAAQAVGIRIGKTRIQCIMIASVLCGLAGSQLSIGFLSMFSEGMTVGKGFIALGALMFSNRRPALVLFITLLFGFAEAIGNQVQLGGTIASELVLMIPYVAVLACVFVRKPVPEQI